MAASTERRPRRAGRGEGSRARGRERRRGSAPVRAIVCAGRRGLELRPHPDDGSFRVPLRDAAGLAPGEIVSVRLERRSARVLRRLGRLGDPELDFDALCALHALPRSFPPACLRESERDSAPEALGRLDLRDLPFVTIDPERARDHDDAVFAERSEAGFRLWVAIADVAAFVPAGSALDREARRRGNSVYLPDRVVPMLPERLSGELCSLRPDEDRLALAVELEVDTEGRTRRRTVCAAHIRSRARLAYGEAAALLAGERRAEPAFEASLVALGEIARRLRARRVAEGSLDFELAEPEPRVDARGRVTGIGRAARSEAHRAIEEAMLAANRAIAELLIETRRPTLHRVHERPDPSELAGLEPVLASLGLWPGRMRRAPAEGDLAELVEAARARPEAGVVHGLLVRAMRQARYADAPLGHFALGFERYLHFTSPIRRYADLVVHRAVRAHLAGERPAAVGLGDLAEYLSRRERAAAQAEYQALDWKRAALLLPRVGERFAGRVSTVAPAGLFVTLEAVQGDGLVPARSLPPRSHLDPRRGLVQLGRTRVRLGDAVTVRLTGVDPARGRLRLALVDHSEGEPSRRPARRSHSG